MAIGEAHNIKQRLIDFGDYLLIILVIINFNTPYTQIETINFLLNNFGIILLFFLIVLNGRIKVDTMFVFVVLGALIPIIGIQGDKILKILKNFIVYLPLFYLYISIKMQNGKIKELFYTFSNIMIVISFISLFFWIFGSQLGLIKPSAHIQILWGELRRIPTYYGLYFETQNARSLIGTGMMMRNSGIFNEGPMYNMVLCTALGVELLFRNNISKWRILVFVVTIGTTITTTGIIYFILIFAYKFYSHTAKYKILIVFFLPILFVLTLLSVQAALDNKKVSGENSYISRVEDINNCIEIGIDNPFLGVGLDYENSLYGNNRWGYSNSMFTIFARGGIYLLSLYLFSFFIVPFLIYKRNKRLTIFILSYTLLFTFTISYNKLLTLLMLSVCLSSFAGKYSQNSILTQNEKH